MLSSLLSQAQTANGSEENVDKWPEHEYNLTIAKQTVNFTGKDVQTMTVKWRHPGPKPRFYPRGICRHPRNEQNGCRNIHTLAWPDPAQFL